MLPLLENKCKHCNSYKLINNICSFSPLYSFWILDKLAINFPPVDLKSKNEFIHCIF